MSNPSLGVRGVSFIEDGITKVIPSSDDDQPRLASTTKAHGEQACVMIDVHIHVLPGLDDGPEEMGEAVDMCRVALADGVSVIVAAPHMCDGLFDVTRDEVLRGVRRLREQLDAHGIALAVLPGGDVRISTDLPQLLKGGHVMTVADRGKYMMVELPHDIVPPGLAQTLLAVQSAGTTPIITHPERNFEMQRDPALLEPLVRSGNLVQLTADSLVGRFGGQARKCARELVTRRMAHLVASDAHSLQTRRPGLSKARQAVGELLPAEEVEEMFVHRPRKILAGEPVTLPEISDERPPKKRDWLPEKQ